MSRYLPALLVFAAVCATATTGEPAWKYVADPTVRPVPRTVPLSEKKPDDLREEVTFRGKTRKYAQIRYGSADSRRVAVVIDEVGPDDWDLYVDADRNRVIDAKDKVGGSGRERSARLDVEWSRGLEILHEPRTILWRLSPSRSTIGMATVGYVAGHVQLGGKRVAVRRVDGDANGFFADPADRLWIDINGDGEWDPISEQFPLLPVLTIGGQRYAVRGDALGSKLALEPLTAEGRIRLRLQHIDKDTPVVKLHAMLVAEDGAAFGATGGDAVVVPAGKYSLGAVSLSVQHAAKPIHFVFSRTGLDSTVRWHELKKDEELILDPIGKLRCDVDVEPAAIKAGETLRVQPQLFTADGLLINSCSFSDSEQISRYDRGHVSFVKLFDAKGQLLDSATSGFA